MIRLVFGLVFVLGAACGEVQPASVRARQDTTQVKKDSAAVAWVPPARCATAPVRPPAPTDTAHADSAKAPATPAPPPASLSRKAANKKGRQYGDTVRAAGPVPASLEGSLLPGCRILAFYGNPMSKRMGILGAVPADTMLKRLAKQAEVYAALDTFMPVIPALQLVTPVAQASPGRDGKYRLRMRDSTIAHFAALVVRAKGVLILDMQVGKSTVGAELVPLMAWLQRPDVHLALDPEFSVKRKDKRPGEVIGTLDAVDVNLVIDTLAALVTRYHLPPKVLIVHRFTIPMLTHAWLIKRDPRVQVVLDMDGFGPPKDKYGSYGAYAHDRPVEFPGVKLFYKQDKPLLTPREVLGLDPVPVYVQYQ